MPQFRRIYIIGFMGSGKTTTGKKLADGLRWSFIDLDREIEAESGKTINEIFSESGEKSFRQMESEILHKLNINKDTVISLGGGTPCFSDNMDYINKTGTAIYLRLSPQLLKNRLSRESDKRPLLKDIPENERIHFIHEKLSEREVHYNRAALIVDADNLRIDALVRRLERLLRDHMRL